MSRALNRENRESRRNVRSSIETSKRNQCIFLSFLCIFLPLFSPIRSNRSLDRTRERRVTQVLACSRHCKDSVDPLEIVALHAKSIGCQRYARPRRRECSCERSGGSESGEVVRFVRHRRLTGVEKIMQPPEVLGQNLHPRIMTAARISYRVDEKARGPV